MIINNNNNKHMGALDVLPHQHFQEYIYIWTHTHIKAKY